MLHIVPARVVALNHSSDQAFSPILISRLPDRTSDDASVINMAEDM
jgi:hypothetical protein